MSRLIADTAQAHAYHAFISYAQASDRDFAPVVRSALHQFAKPWYKLRAVNVFLDKSNLAGTPNLSGALVKALNETEWLLLMASPASAQSPWVREEIIWWLAHRSIGRLLILLTDGTIVWNNANGDFDWARTTALSDALSKQLPAEPLHVDLREIKKSGRFSLRSLEFRDKIASIASALRNIPKHVLDGEDVRQFRRIKTAGRIFVLMLVAVLGLSALSYVQRDKAEQNRINLTANAVENAADADLQLEALTFALHAGHQMQQALARWDAGLHRVLDNDGWQETHARVLAKLLQALAGFHQVNRLEWHGNDVVASAYRPDCPGQRQLWASGDKDGKLVVWEGDRDDPVGLNANKLRISQRHAPITAIAVAPDCSEIAVAALDGKVALQQPNGALIDTADLGSTIQAIAYSPDGESILFGDENGLLILANRRGEKIQSVEANADGVRIVGLSVRRCPDGKQRLLTATAGIEQPLQAWELTDVLKGAHGFSMPEIAAGDKVTAVDLSQDCMIAALGTRNGILTVWPWAGNSTTRHWQAHQGVVNSLHFSGDGRYLVSAGEADYARLPAKPRSMRSIYGMRAAKRWPASPRIAVP